jgi:hypothetical protein
LRPTQWPVQLSEPEPGYELKRNTVFRGAGESIGGRIFGSAVIASAPGANDGFIKLWIDNTLVETLGSLDNDSFTTSLVDFGLVSGVDSTTSGTMYFDQFESYRVAAEPTTEVTETPTTEPTTDVTEIQIPTPTDLGQAETATPTVTPTRRVEPVETETATPETPVVGLPGGFKLVALARPYRQQAETATPTATGTPTVTATVSASSTTAVTVTVSAISTTAAASPTPTATQSEIENPKSEITYAYDSLNRLTSATYLDGLVYAYEYRCNGKSSSKFGQKASKKCSGEF